MGTLPFTDLALRSLPPGTYYDEKLPSFGMRVGKRRKTWIVVLGRGRVKTRIGHFPQLALADARKKAHALIGSPPESRSTPHFREALDEFLEEHGRTLRPRSRKELTRVLKKHFDWNKRLDHITHQDVANAISAIRHPSAAAHAFKDIRTFFNWCVPRYLPSSPCQGLKTPYRYAPRQRVLTDDELKRVWNAAGLMKNYGAHVRLLILTGQRVGQFLTFDAAWMNTDEKLITFPAHIMKNNREHVIPYGEMALSLLPPKPMTYQGKYKKELDKLSSVSDWVLHDLRRVLASQWAALGIPLHVIEAYLSHRSGTFGGIVGVYQVHSWLPEMRQAVTQWEVRLQEIVAS